ncbi:MAG: FUSC family protein [Bordetella sp.]|uniref:FUSC family protein n=1 Tax=Bordetella sp. TaxID=28081 RepID=UPI003F7C4AA3
MNYVTRSFAAIRSLASDIARDLRDIARSAPRTLDETAAVAAVLLSIACAHALGEQNIGWAAFSAYMVMRPNISLSLQRGLLRIAGTAVGAAGALFLPAQVLASSALLSAVLAIVGAATLYLALTERSGYAWLFAGITFAMVVIEPLAGSHSRLIGFAISRIAEVTTGTICGIGASALCAAIVKRAFASAHAPSAAPPSATPRRWRKKVGMHALKGGVALALLPFASKFLHLPYPAQAAVTILAVLMMPQDKLEAANSQTVKRMAHRFAGCMAGGLLATAGLLTLHQSTVLLWLLTMAGIVIGRHIENSRTGGTYIGTQFALVFLFVLVPDSYSAVDVDAGLQRFLGIVSGIVLLALVMLAARLPRPPLAMRPGGGA